MASGFESSLHRGSDVEYELCCDTCEEKDINREAQFYCEKCSKFYCNPCAGLHDQLYSKHVRWGRKDMKKWPVAKTASNKLEVCQRHNGEKLRVYCENHSQMLCTVCHIYDHQKCRNVVLIADKLKELCKNEDFHQLSKHLARLQNELNQNTKEQNKNLQNMQQSYKKSLDKIQRFRTQINAHLDELEKKTLTEMNTLVTTVKSYIQTKIDECKKLNEQMQDLQSEIQNTGNKTEVMSYLLYTKCVDHLATTESFLREATFRNGTTLDVEMYTAIDQTLSSFPGLGMVSKGNCIPKHTVEIRGNSFPCSISGICETANGELIVTDFSNKKVTLLNKSYTVVNKYGLPNYPWSMCRVNSNQVAIAVGDSVSKNVVLLVQAINGGLILERTEELQHRLIGIACNECFFYITSGTELFRYNMNFQNKIKIYEDNSNIQTVTACAVSSDGHRIYVVNSACDQLVTLTRDGAVLSILGDPALQLGILLPSTPGVLVTDSGKVLVCGIFSNTIIEVDKDGIQRRADFLKGKYVIRPTSVCISKITGHIIVGMYNGDVLMF